MRDIVGGIIAAGEGSRLRGEPGTPPKALIPVGGVPLLGRTLESLRSAGLREFVVILNEASSAAGGVYLREAFGGEEVTLLCKNTASSFESFVEVLRTKPARHFVVSTVDSIHPPGALKGFLEFARGLGREAVGLGVTDYIDDEKPLYADLAPDGRVRELGSRPCPWATCGVYFLHASLAVGSESSRFPALRGFLGDLVRRNHPVFGFPMGEVVDVDRPEDLAAAEALLRHPPRGGGPGR